MSVKKNLGSRFSCSDCGRKFYDLHRSNPTCPKCGGLPATIMKKEYRISKVAALDVDTDDADVLPDELEIVPIDELADEFADDYSEDALA